ncbi:hypothetical protein [Altererythrobacter lutimaris]|uniref:hypothetical protein n=1 Tax=Altererythrobacter lutimaris TaxID=2743979 RepID=UPI001E5ADFF4|nr:hypothetical protein [Altererythrobacter lutimaris]
MGDLLEFLLFAVPITGALAAGYLITRDKFNHLRLALAEERGANKTATIAMEKMALEERVRVLERIVTDKGYDVSEQIEALRDIPARELPAPDRETGSGTPLIIENKERA